MLFFAIPFAAVAIISGLLGYWLGHRDRAHELIASEMATRSVADVQTPTAELPRSTRQAVDTGDLLERVMNLQGRSETLDIENVALRSQIIDLEVENQRLRGEANTQALVAGTQDMTGAGADSSIDTVGVDSAEVQQASPDIVYNITNVTDGSLLTARQKTREQMDANQDGDTKEVMIYLDGGSAGARVSVPTTERVESQQTPIDQ